MQNTDNLTEGTREKLRQTIAKIERLEEEKKEVADQIKRRSEGVRLRHKGASPGREVAPHREG